MVKFKIKVENGKTIPKPFGKHTHVEYYVVYVSNAGEWVFQKAFYTEERAKKFIAEIQQQIDGGDYSCLTLRS